MIDFERKTLYSDHDFLATLASPCFVTKSIDVKNINKDYKYNIQNENIAKIEELNSMEMISSKMLLLCENMIGNKLN